MKRPNSSFKFALIVCLILSVNHSFSQKAFEEYYVDKSFDPFTSYTSKALPTTTANAIISVDHNVVVNNVRQSLFANNAVGWQGNLTTTNDREQHWKNAGFSLLRYPGGNWSNLFFWDGNTPSTILNESTLKGDINNLQKGNDAWMLETDEFPDLLNFIDADGIVCVNVGYAFYGTSTNPVETAAQYAANWVKHYNVDLNLGVKYWELGNENYGPWQAGFDLSTPQKYADACKIFAQKMKAVDPTIKIGVNFYEGDGGFNQPQGKNWNELVLPIVQEIMDFAIIHHYPHPANNRNDILEKDIYSAVHEVEKTIEWFHRQTTTYTSKPAGYFPIAITEFNARTGVREISRTNALFTTMMLGEYAKYNDYAAAIQWDLQNGYTVGLGDHGLTSKGDPFMVDGSPNPSFYAYYYMNRYFGNQLITSNSTDTNIVIYATKFTSGELGLVVINKSNTDKVIDINLGNYAKGNRFYWHTINGDNSDFDRTLYVNNQGPSTTFNIGETYTNGTRSEVATAFDANGVGGPLNYAAIKPYSALIATTGNTKFSTGKYSATYIVFEKSTSGCSIPYLGPDRNICGVPNSKLTTGLSPAGLTFKWSKGGTDLGTSSELSISTSGIYKVEVNDGDCISTDEITIKNTMPPIGLGNDVVLCSTREITVSALSTIPNTSYEWRKDGQIVGSENSLIISEAGSYSATINASGCLSTADTIIVSSKLAYATGDTVCSDIETAELKTQEAGNYAWFSTETGGIPLSTSNTFTTTVSKTTTYYLEKGNTVNYPLGKVGIDGSTYGNGAAGVYSNDNRKTIFTVEKPITLHSLKVFVQTEGTNMTLNINGPSYSKTWSFNNLTAANGGGFVANLNTLLTTGTYTIDLIGTTGGIKIQFDNNSNQSLQGIGSFYTGGGNTDWYGMYFDWKISTNETCVRTPATIVYDPTPGCITGDSEELKNEIFIYPNPSETGVFKLNKATNWEVFDAKGLFLKNGNSNQVDLSEQAKGLYFIKMESAVQKVIIH